MSEGQSTIDLASLFETAAEALSSQKEAINALDDFNGNHGDNMAENVRIIANTIRAHEADPPDEALRAASAQLSQAGHGGTSQYYTRGLLDAADKLSGKAKLDTSDGLNLIQSLLGAVPAQGYPEQGQSAPSVLDLLMGMGGGTQQPAPAPQPQGGQLAGLLDMVMGSGGGAQQAAPAPEPQPQSGQLGGLLDMVMGLTGAGATPQAPSPQNVPTAKPTEAEAGTDRGDLSGLLDRLLPAGMAYLQAKQAGADTAQAAQAALIGAVMGVQPATAQTPRQGAGAALAQGMLKALLGR